MARTKRSQDLDTRTKRLALPIGKRHTDTLAEGCYILYKRPVNGASGNWIARRYDMETKKFRQEVVGVADDLLDADEIKVFTFAQAQKLAEKRFEDWAREAVMEAGGEVPHKGPYTVADAWSDYIADAGLRGVHGIRIMQQTAEAHILPALGGVDLSKLTPKRVRDWHQELATKARRKTGAPRKPGDEVEHLANPETEDELRARKDTANRILTNLKAALNFAKANKGIGRATDWRAVKPFHGVSVSRVVFLTVEEQQRLVNACDPIFRPLVKGGIYTGARYGELCKTRVRDYNPQSNTLFIEFGKAKHGYKPRHVILTAEGAAFFASHVAGRCGDEPMFLRGEVKRLSRKEALKDYDGWAPYDETRLMRAAVKASKVDKDLDFYGLRHTYASGLINRGVPLAFVAEQLGHSNTRMVEKHYGHLCPSAKAESIRLLAPVLGISGEQTVKALETKKA